MTENDTYALLFFAVVAFALVGFKNGGLTGALKGVLALFIVAFVLIVAGGLVLTALFVLIVLLVLLAAFASN